VPGDGETRFAERAKFFAGVGRKMWLDWRAKKLAEFYRRIQLDIADVSPTAKLYLAGEDLLTSAEVRDALHPRLPFRPKFDDALRQHGIDVARLQQDKSIVFMRPERFKPVVELAEQAVNLQTRNAKAIDALFQPANPGGSLLFHEAMTLPLPTFDAVSPFGKDRTRTWLASHIPPNGIHNRARFIHSIATLDSQVLVEGGWLLPLGQEAAVQRQLAAYRMLPAAAFKTIAPNTESAQAAPLVVRTRTQGERTYFYLANDSPWPLQAEVEWDIPAGAKLQPFHAAQPAQLTAREGKQLWSVKLEAYDLLAGFVTAPNAAVHDWKVQFNPAIKIELTELVQQVKSRVNTLRKREPLNVIQNPGFEIGNAGKPVGWQFPDPKKVPGVIVDLDTAKPFKGKQSLHMKATGNRVAWIRSQRFAPPTTGRISVLVWARTRDKQKQPPLRIAVDDGQHYYRFAPLGTETGGANNVVEKLSAEWPQRPYLFHVDNLPSEQLDSLMIGFDLMGEGEVWLDDVQVFDLYFFDTELNELIKNAGTANFQLKSNRIGEGERYLEGYWPRFLLEHVPPARMAAAPRNNTRPNPPAVRDASVPPAERHNGLQRYLPKLPKWKLPFSSDD